ncbi:MAG: sulfotransferase [Candidatus Promineifilaceae bacterium]|nr:sulfotransferase [Candidatus Promineifilaceae bacterium]
MQLKKAGVMKITNFSSGQINKPIFVVGSGRSGTTLIYRLLASHRDLAWFSNWTDYFPKHPELALLSRLADYVDSPLLTKRKYWPIPDIEGIRILKSCNVYAQLWRLKRPVTAQDIPTSASQKLIDIIKRHQRFQGKPRFIHKNISNSMRIPYLKAVFPDAKFIHVVRDGRAVAMSLKNVAFWKELDLWWTDYTPATWEAEGKDPLLLCGLHWQMQVNEISAVAEKLPQHQFYCIRYEDFVEDPIFWLNELVQFSELDWDPKLETKVKQRRIRNMNGRWESAESPDSIALLEESLANTLKVFGY